jgi:hypothetical protein
MDRTRHHVIGGIFKDSDRNHIQDLYWETACGIEIPFSEADEQDLLFGQSCSEDLGCEECARGLGLLLLSSLESP